MAQIDTTHELDFLLHESGKDSASLLAQAMQEGIHVLFKRQVIEAYISKQIPREQALAMLGSDVLSEIEYAWLAVENDIAWGIGNA